jgi:hypothetical protein
MYRYLLLLGILTIAACSGGPSTTEAPKGRDMEYKEDQGKLTGDGLFLFGKSDAEKAADGSPVGVNSFLWRATLDTLSFMPLASADPFGGVIITEWFSPPESPGERFKVNVFILGRDLRADGVRAAVFKQSREPSGNWLDAPVEAQTATDLENSILSRARQLRVNTAQK